MWLLVGEWLHTSLARTSRPKRVQKCTASLDRWFVPRPRASVVSPQALHPSRGHHRARAIVIHVDAVRWIAERGGAARLSDLKRAGVRRRDLERLIESGRLVRPYRGCYSLPGSTRAANLACYFDGALTCVTAATAIGLRTLASHHKVHLEVAADRGGHRDASPPHREVRLHRSRTCGEPGTVVGPARALDVAALCVSPIAQLVMIDHALSIGFLRPEDIAGFSRTPVARRAWLQRYASALAGSVPETCARVALMRAGLEVECQPPIGSLQRADFLVEGLVYVEIDGFAHHSDRHQFDIDRARDRALLARGRPVLRFTYRDAVVNPDRLVEDVLRALRVLRR